MNTKRGWLALLAAGLLAVVLAGCGGGDKGDTGDTGATGPAGPAGPPGPTGPAAAGVVDAAQLSYSELENRALAGKIISVDTSGNQPVVQFQVVMKDTNQPIVGLRTFSLHIAQLKPAANGSASYWLNYIADGLPATAIPAATAAPTNPATDSVTSFNTDGTIKAQGYKVVDNKDGTYTVTFGANIKANTKVVYDPSLTHRVVVGVRSVAVPGVVGKTAGAYAGPINPNTGAVVAQFTNTNGVNLVADFKPSATGAGTIQVDSAGNQTFARDIVTVDACNQCHFKIQYGFPRGNNTSGHFGSRTDTKTCVVCHTPQNDYDATLKKSTGEGDFTSFIHTIHMGEELSNTQNPVGVAANEVKYPTDQRDCVHCHKGTQADAWKTTPTRKACGACHDSIDWSTGANHVGKAQADDAKCTLCHTAADVATYHVAVVPPDPNNLYAKWNPSATTQPGNTNTNASYVAAAGAVPDGASKITYLVNSVTRLSNGNVSIQFKLQKDGQDVVFNTYSASGKKELIDNFVGSPSVYFAWAVAQDGIAAPADYNATASTYIKNIWRGDGKDVKGAALAAAAQGTMTGPTSGWYTITLTGVNVPSTATMLTGGVGYTYSLSATPPLVQTNVAAYPYTPNAATVNAGVGGTGGLSVPPPNVWKVATGFTGRRLIVDNSKCNACHNVLGVKPTFHAGQRNDAQTCTFCHLVNRTNSGWPVNINYDVHAIHGQALRQNKFSWEATAGAKYWETTYPGLLKNCEMCHIAGMYDYSNTNATTGYGANASLVDRLLMTTAASGTINAAGFPIITGSETVTSSSSVISPFVTPGTNYGAVFAFNAATGVTTPADATTLVLSPISAACSGCHDSGAARAHMQANGGTVFEPRSVAATRKESCLVCHGPANNALFNETPPAIKTVHRWW